MLAVARDSLRRDRFSILDQQRNPGARRYIHLGAQCADRRNRLNDPFHLGRGFRIDGIALELRPRRGDQHSPGLARELLPYLLGNKWHDWVEQVDNAAQDPSRCGLRLGARCRVLPLQDRLRELQVPVTEGAPDEVVKPARRLVETICVESSGNRSGRIRHCRGDPTVDR